MKSAAHRELARYVRVRDENQSDLVPVLSSDFVSEQRKAKEG